jgi:hypothetical protein
LSKLRASVIEDLQLFGPVDDLLQPVIHKYDLVIVGPYLDHDPGTKFGMPDTRAYSEY